MIDTDLSVTAKRYSMMTDRQLLEFAPGYEGLTEGAKVLLVEEFKRRSLAMPVAEPKRAALRTTAFDQMSHRQILRAVERFDELSEADKAALQGELASRGLEMVDEGADADVPAGEEARLVTVARYRDMPEAVVARAVLESAGIACYLRDENTVHMDWAISNAIGGMRLQVDTGDEAAAREILTQPVPASFAVDSGADFEQPVCPKCGSLNVMANDADRKIKLASTVAFGLPMVVGLPALAMVTPDVWKCLDCGCKWQDDEEPGDEPDGAGGPAGL